MFEEYVNCLRTSICECSICFYETLYHWNTNGLGLSFDAILGYHILPNINISRQLRAVLISLILSTVIITEGIIHGILLLVTFKNNKTRESGCGIHLLCSSIITFILIIIFTLRCWILIVTQSGLIQNRLFLQSSILFNGFSYSILFNNKSKVNCICIYWKSIYNKKKSIHLDKKKTISTVKWKIFGLVLITILTNIPDPI